MACVGWFWYICDNQNKNAFSVEFAAFPQVTISGLLGLPFPETISNRDKDRLTALVTRILDAKSADPSTDTSALEREVDERVYALYGLTEEEIRIVEGGK